MWGAWRASSEAVNQLMDREWPEDERQEFLAALRDYPELDGLHDLRTRTSGTSASSSSTSGSPPTGPCSRRTTGSITSRSGCSIASPGRKS